MAAPEALPPSVQKADHDRRQGRAAEDQQRRFRIFINRQHLPVDRRGDEADERPAAPEQRARHAPAEAVAADPFRERAFRTEKPAPHAPDDDDGQNHERPPDPPEHELRESREMIEDAGAVGRQGHERRNRDQARVDRHDRPLQGNDRSAMATKKIAQRGEPWLRRRRRDRRDGYDARVHGRVSAGHGAAFTTMRPFAVSSWNSSIMSCSPGCCGATTMNDVAPGTSTFSLRSERLSNSAGPGP